MNIEEAIAATLADWHANPFGWADANCDFSVADYVVRLTGRDPAAEWRGRCSGESEAHRLKDEAGGNAALIRQGMLSAGACVVDTPALGDVVACRLRGLELPGIYLEPYAAFRSPAGVLRSRMHELIEAYRCV
ncbi:DUF6950 family protein [Pararhizobium mangrovi]|uniref:DUF6950 domain-containing protein n=1 Tax=Pararhizobium mangrovi TaxID=2590452 RepID=A0A506UDZ8_9HYPH|nr:hypothetical protein [Pararhizobium mangrovi]TPW31174.1 hypothetical protein FJU11_02960 [Pararhizobium mangrovi]